MSDEPPVGAVLKLDMENELWLVTTREIRLRRRGWTGTLSQYNRLYEAMNRDPLLEDPPITEPPPTS